LEGTAFKDGHYKALVLLAGPCRWCAACARGRGESCTRGAQARPAMEACGIDVFQTARNNGFPIETLREKTETQNLYSLLSTD
jgi:predicted metal-binding protein